MKSARVQLQQPGIQPEEMDGVGDDDVASDSYYGTTCLFQASGSLLYFDKSIRSEVFSFPHPDLLYLTCDYIVTHATFLSLFLIFLNLVHP